MDTSPFILHGEHMVLKLLTAAFRTYNLDVFKKQHNAFYIAKSFTAFASSSLGIERKIIGLHPFLLGILETRKELAHFAENA